MKGGALIRKLIIWNIEGYVRGGGLRGGSWVIVNPGCAVQQTRKILPEVVHHCNMYAWIDIVPLVATARRGYDAVARRVRNR